MNEDNKHNSTDDFLMEIYKCYASKGGHKVENVIALIGTIAAIFSGYGYMYIMPLLQNPNFVISNGGHFWENLYTLSLVAITLLGCILLSLLYFISLNFGYTSAKERHVLHIVNCMKGITDIYKYNFQQENKPTLPLKKYNKKNFIPDFYLGLCVVSIVLQLFLVMTTIVRLLCCDVAVTLIICVSVIYMIQYILFDHCYRKFLKHID